METTGTIGLTDVQKVKWLERTRSSDTFRDVTTRGLQQDANEAVETYFNLERHDIYNHRQLEGPYSHSTERAEVTKMVLQQLYGSAALLAQFVREMAHGHNDPEELLRYAEVPIEFTPLDGSGSELHCHFETKSPSIILDPEPSTHELWQVTALGNEGLRRASRRANLAHMMGLLLLNLSPTTKLQIHSPSYQFWSPEKAKGQQIFARNFAAEFVAGPPTAGSIKSQIDHLQARHVDLETMGRVLAYRNNAFVSVGLSSTDDANPTRWSQEFGPYLFSESLARGLQQTAGERQPSPNGMPNSQAYVSVVNSNRAKKIYYLAPA
jgi:hypothetical protein